ncbi:hypothetical protein CS022_07015 [Veronia nyctiphanis]|uniref:Uncharacterized protein n=1 Tax=Veronia nyctiphanis TaxID=1278244 RepID=A0A4Q0YRE7_9GAMM|nr:questin oxidase family protein [Veronia nyctiphanis]RXJ73757.1 hypothetical protein CS022_07015 [Veronia nyctiphanis]
MIDRAKIVRLVTTQFIASNDFTLLHGVTGLQALLSLEPFIDDIDKALGYFWQAYVAAVCTSTYRHAFVPLATTSDNQKEWNSWFTKALASKNDHTIKLVYSCAWLYQSIALPELLMAIQAVLGEQS